MVTHVPAETPGDERGMLLSFVEAQRGAIRRSLIGLTEEQAASRPSAGELSLSGLLKHVAETELNWLRMAQQRPNESARTAETWADSFRLVGDETVARMLEFWDGVAAETEKFIRSVPDLGDTFPLPEAPWFPAGSGSRCGGCWPISSRRPPGTPGTPTSSGRPWTAGPRPSWSPRRGLL